MPVFPGSLDLNPQAISARLRKPPQRAEFFGLALSLGMAVVFIVAHPDNIFYDLRIYLQAARGDFSQYYYGYWFVPVFWLLDQLPLLAAAMALSLASIAAVFFAGRVFGTPAWLILAGYQMLYVLYYGQLSAVILGGLALLWWGLANRRWDWAGLGLLLAATKYQTGLLVGGFLLLYAPLPWRSKWKALLVPAAGFILAWLLFPGWIGQQVQAVRQLPANDFGSLAPWQWLGGWALLFWLPPLLLPMPAGRRLVFLAAANTLALPYFQQADLIILFALPSGWIAPLLGNVGYLAQVFGYAVFQWLVAIPLLVYAALLGTQIASIFHRRQWTARPGSAPPPG